MTHIRKITKQSFEDQYEPVHSELFVDDYADPDFEDDVSCYSVSGDKFKKDCWEKFLLVGSWLHFEENQLHSLLKTILPHDQKACITSPAWYYKESYEIILPKRQQIDELKHDYIFNPVPGELTCVYSSIFGCSKKWGVLVHEDFKVAGFEPDLAETFRKEVGGTNKLKELIKEYNSLHIKQFGIGEKKEHLLKSVGWDPEEFEDIESEDDDGRPDRGSRRLIWFKDIESGNDENEEEG